MILATIDRAELARWLLGTLPEAEIEVHVVGQGYELRADGAEKPLLLDEVLRRG